MRKLVLFALAGLMAVSAVVSCSKDNTVDQNIKSKIVGSWKLYSVCGQEVPTNDKIMVDFASDGTHYYTNFSGPIWQLNEAGAYFIEGRKLEIVPLIEPSEEESVTANVYSVDKYKLVLTDVSYSTGQNRDKMDFQRVNNDYTALILGLWEGTQVIGEQTHGDAEHRWEYKSDGTFIYYSKDKDGKWIPDPDNEGNTFFVKGDYVVSNWSYKGVSYQESWDVITCNSYEMEWTALRHADDGSEFTTTLRMKRVIDQEEISKKILGKWKTYSINNQEVLTDSRNVLTFCEDGTLMQTNFADGKWEYQVVDEYTVFEKEVIYLSTRNTVVSINDKEMIYSPVRASSRIIYDNQAWTRVTEDFKQAILGTWEGVAMTGDPTYGDIDHRWEYKANGTYVYYSRNAAGEWIPEPDDSDCVYAVDGDFLCSRWKYKGKSNREWWDIDTCDESTMIWSAGRKNSDGEYNYTVFVLVKVTD